MDRYTDEAKLYFFKYPFHSKAIRLLHSWADIVGMLSLTVTKLKNSCSIFGLYGMHVQVNEVVHNLKPKEELLNEQLLVRPFLLWSYPIGFGPMNCIHGYFYLQLDICKMELWPGLLVSRHTKEKTEGMKLCGSIRFFS